SLPRRGVCSFESGRGTAHFAGAHQGAGASGSGGLPAEWGSQRALSISGGAAVRVPGDSRCALILLCQVSRKRALRCQVELVETYEHILRRAQYDIQSKLDKVGLGNPNNIFYTTLFIS